MISSFLQKGGRKTTSWLYLQRPNTYRLPGTLPAFLPLKVPGVIHSFHLFNNLFMFNHLLKKARLLLSVGLCVSLPFAGMAQGTLKDAAQAAKVTPELFRVIQSSQAAQGKPGQRAASVATTMADEGPQLEAVDKTDVRDGRIAIEAIADDEGAQNLLSDLQALGLTEGVQYQRIIFGYLPIEKLADLKNLNGLRFARPSYKPMHNAGRVNSQGDRAMRSDLARQTYGVTGAGNKVGVLSDSYNARGGAAAGVASDDLPVGVEVTDDDLGASNEDVGASNEDEGRAMAEIIHDVAPGAAIAFNTANRGQSGFANGILNLAKRGCNIIVDDVFYFAEPFFQDGIVAQAVNQVVKNNGVTYFSSAGNHARNSYQNAFVNSGKPAPGLTLADGVAHNFMDGSILQSVTLAAGGGEFFGIYQWDQPFYSVSGKPGSASDIDLFVYSNGQLLTQFSSTGNNLGDDPIEAVRIRTTATTTSPVVIQIAIVKYAGPDPGIIKFINYGSGSRVQYLTNSSTTAGHANAEGAIAVGAAYALNTPAFNPNLARPVIENFSSAGGTPIVFTTDGKRIQPIVRQKPEIVAPDGGSTTFFFRLQGDVNGDGFPDFFGTSAAAPHAAAVAALMQQQSKNTLSSSSILTNLIRSAIDMDDPATPGFDAGFDFGTGFGFIQADRALSFGQPFGMIQPLYNCQTNTITLQTANGNGSLIEYQIPGVTGWTTNPVQTLSAGLVNDQNTVLLQLFARQNGQVVSLLFNFRQACALNPAVPVPGASFTVLAPAFNCQNGTITVRTTVGNGTRIEYRVPGATDWTTNPVTVLDPGAFNDSKVTTITVQARQSGVVVSTTFNFRDYCRSIQSVGVVGNGSMSSVNTAMAADERITPAPESVDGLQVTVMDNPAIGNWADVQVLGAQNQSLMLRVNGMKGERVSEQSFETSQPGNRYRVPLGQAAGLYLLQVNTPTQTKLVKILKQ